MKNRKPKADGRYVVNVSFTAQETSLLSWADSHGNFSNYVKRLIEADMNKRGMANEIPNDLLQKMMLNMVEQGMLKGTFQKDANAEVSTGFEKEEQPQKKPKLNKSAIGNIMKKKV